MTTRDSGVIDLFAIHKEEEVRKASIAPSAPPPAVALDLSVSDDEIDGYAEHAKKARKRTVLFGGIVGGLCVVAVILGSIALGGDGKDAAKPTAAAQPPPPAVTAPPPATAEPAPAPPPASASANAKDEKPEYNRATAAAAYAAQQRKAKGLAVGGARPAGRAGGGVKMQKIQSSGIP